MSWHDKTQEGNQRKEIERLKKEGKSPKEAAQLAKKKFPLTGKAGKKNRQGGASDPGRGGRAGRGGDDGSGRQSGAFGKGW